MENQWIDVGPIWPADTATAILNRDPGKILRIEQRFKNPRETQVPREVNLAFHSVVESDSDLVSPGHRY